MITTTSYGTWNNHGDHTNTTIGGTVLDCINGGDAEWRERVESSGALDRMVADYRDAISAALPDSVSLCGDEFTGPYYAKDCEWAGDLDIAAIVEAIDLGAIVERHDPDSAGA
jgi:hypothetical protein